MLPETQKALHRFYDINHSIMYSATKDFKPIKSYSSPEGYSPYGNFDEMTTIYQLMYNLYLTIDGDLFRCDYNIAYAHPKECIDEIDKLSEHLLSHIEVLQHYLDKYSKTEVPFPIKATFDFYTKANNLLKYVYELDEIIGIRQKHYSEKSVISKVDNYVNLDRINKIAVLHSTEYDFSKLVQLLKELNSNWKENNVYTVGLLLRTIINHIPPIFGARTFDQVIAELPNKKQSPSRAFKHLNDSLREIADGYTHQLIRKLEVLPTEQQVEYKSDFDVLLCQIILKGQN